MDVTRAGPSDLERLVALGRRCYTEHFRGIWTPAGLEAYLSSQYDRDAIARDLRGETVARWNIAFEQGEAIGFTKTLRERLVPDGSGRRGLELEKIYLTTASTGRGHGKALLTHVVSIAAEDAQPWIWLDVLKSNVAGARFYARAGFERVAEIPFATDTGPIGMWVMCRPTLTSPACRPTNDGRAT